MPRGAGLLGAALWTLQPLYVLVELLIGLRASADYSFAGSTVSDLGDSACRQVRGDLLCSPWHAGMNAAFIWFGCTLALGAVLFGARHLPGRAGRAAVLMWCVSGLGSIGVGLFPVNEDPVAHGIVALLVFVAQPLALLLAGLSLRASRPRLAAATYVVAAASAIGAVGFGLLVGSHSPVIGAVERLGLWPGYVWVCVLVVSTVRGRSAQTYGAR
ncbi:DUF998 domain-containing protein [Aeromicrobium wangtongii]|uniref:DUF998 domain-containing protein n=1 Tax=Aeromicrobium wangtongii TaxID=2969247 RepID=UPI0020173FB5|nr:DUF998 domain-containing protein [Aeromicrobium wangtongii]MCL3819025.1 DUF998 domain-containing protein [Aeromicrobium wangtongii]